MRTLNAWLATAIVLVAAGLTAQAGVVGAPLGNSGWQVVGADGGEVGVTVDREGIDTDGKRYVAIEIIKVYRTRPDPQTEALPPVNLNFIQTAPSQATAERIYIADESITNFTGVTWRDFHWIIGITGTARFNRELTNPTGDPQGAGFRLAPFTGFEWADGDALGTETLSAFGGAVPTGAAFFPGAGEGNLVIDIVGLDRLGPAVFTLKEIPTIPEPASLLLIGGGAAWVLLKRRSLKI
jgi:hypothetical protein